MRDQISQKLTMIKRWTKIVMGKTEVAVEQGLGRCYCVGELEGYWNDLTGKVSPNTLLDENGVPFCVIAGDRHAHFPIAIFQYALGRYDLSLLDPDRSDEHLAALRTCADWAVAKQRADGSWDAFGPIGSSRYTVSSMAQGEGCSMLLRAYKSFGEEIYRNSALQAARFMLVDMEKGGTAVHEGSSLFLEEYPQEPRRSVMNGWIFSLFGLYDAACVEPAFENEFRRSSETLAAHLDDYDAGYWSYYDLEGRIASPAYHALHIAQLKALFQMTGNIRFEQMTERFEEYAVKRSNRARAITAKIAQKITEKSDAVIVQ